jgi:uncharacterized oligopeptide transporter (OPT) family protein
MRWQGQRQSTNIEDRRGMRVTRRGVMGGGLGLLAVMLIGMFLGVDPRLILGGAQVVNSVAPPQPQVVAQFFGILTGSLVGSLVYLRLIPDPASMLITEEWPAPAVATWKVVAETLSHGLGSIPGSALAAVAIAGSVGILASVMEHWREPRWLPSMSALGLAMVIPASLSITMFLGSLVALALARWRPTLAQRFVIAAASGLIAGESLTGVLRALLEMLG